MKTLLKLLPILFLLVLPVAGQAQYTFTTNSGTITITGYTGPGGAVTIPSTITGRAVTSIGDYVFNNKPTLTSVTIPDSVVSIGNGAFSYSASLTNVTIGAGVSNIGNDAFGGSSSLSTITVNALNATFSSVAGVLFNKSQTTLILYPPGKSGSYTVPNGVTGIGDSAFLYCASLIRVTIPNSVSSIGNYAFADCINLTNVAIGSGVASIGVGAFGDYFEFTAYGCTKLIAITVDAANSIYSSVAGVLFNKSQTTLIQYPQGKAGSYTVPNSVTGIGDSAFFNCPGLTNVIIGSSVVSIGNRAFTACNNLNSITIPSSVTSIGDWAFSSCPGLTNVIVGNHVSDIGSFVFADCTNLTGVYFQGNVPVNVGSDVFAGDNNATVYYLPETIGWGATFGGRPAVLLLYFTYTTNSGTITITGYTGPGGAVTIPSTINGLPVTSIGDYAFERQSSLTSVTVPNSVTYVGAYAFGGCTSLTNASIGIGVTSINSVAFARCASLTTVTIGNGVTNIENYAFDQCPMLARVFFQGNAPSGSGYGSGYVFGDNTIATVYFLPGTTGWGTTFAGRPTALWPVQDWKYSYNNGKITLTEYTGAGGAVNIPSTIFGVPVTTIGDGAFRFCYYLISVTIPNGVTSIGSGAFADCWGLQSVTLPNTLTTIKSGAFADCWDLQTIIIPASVTTIGEWAFRDCTSLTGVYFQGNARSVSLNVFYNDSATVYYQPGTIGWGATFAGRPTALWPLPYPLILSSGPGFGVKTNKFGFTISWATNIAVVVEACTNLTSPVWSPVATNTLTSGTSYFSDSKWTNSARRFYRLRSP